MAKKENWNEEEEDIILGKKTFFAKLCPNLDVSLFYDHRWWQQKLLHALIDCQTNKKGVFFSRVDAWEKEIFRSKPP